ncbi:MAG: hypothetical protein JWN97_2167 [Nocardioides sp.]|nr:hypothetical protein [Nocardioides sp.]
MNPLLQRPSPSGPRSPAAAAAAGAGHPAPPPVWRLNLMRVGYAVMGVGLALTKWPELLAHDPWELKQGTVLTMLVALSVLALLGLRHPLKMLPILLFEVAWKLLWLGVVALPLWLDGNLGEATREQAATVLWVVIVIAVVPWRFVVDQLVLSRGERWR